ncbi:MAG: ATP-dependent sacrificial sulfur transferase LarE [Janthinobacterium lividum]
MQSLARFLPVNSDSQTAQPTLEEKYQTLQDTLRGLGSVVIGFSGGADSALLAKVAYDVLGENALAVIALSESYARRERDDALALAATMGIPVLTVEAKELDDENYASNPTNRCYYCKTELFTHLSRVASERGIRWIAYGANHDDLGDYRPGQVAAAEFGVLAPLLEAGLTKAEIRHLSKSLGLATWDKPALACLSSRFPYGTRITAELLARLDDAEDYLRHDLGFKQVRVRHHDTIARLEVDPSEMDRLMEPALRGQISDRLKALGYTYVAVELGGYKSGSLNANLGSEHGH